MAAVCSLPTLLYFGVAGRVLAGRIAMFAAFGKDGWVNEMVCRDCLVWPLIVEFENLPDRR